MKKKLLALALSVSMVMGVALTANAAPITAPDDKGAYTSGEFTVDTTVQTPTISITVPATQSPICFNPFGLSYTPTGGVASTDKVVTAAQEIENGSNVAVQVNVVDIQAVVGANSDISIATAPWDESKPPKNKGVFLYIDAVEGAASAATFEPYTKGKDNQYVITKSKTTKSNIIQLAAKPAAGDAPKASYKICGNVVTTPPTAWKTGDTVKITYKLTFTPVVPTSSTP